jgi:hypothetical protein
LSGRNEAASDILREAHQGTYLYQKPPGGFAAMEEQIMKTFLRSMSSNLGVVGELLAFLWARKRWWLIPMVTVLLIFGLFLIFASASGVGPLIYTLF